MPILKTGKLGKKPCKFIKTINVVYNYVLFLPFYLPKKMIKKEIQFYKKNVYGNENIYLKNEVDFLDSRVDSNSNFIA